jgi:hypothetical protein
VTLIDWNKDSALLHKLIEQRFQSSLHDYFSSEEIWQKFFPTEIDDIPVKDYLLNQILPKPRDIIFLCKEALLQAIILDHSHIEVEDIKKAEYAYSKHAHSTLVEELASHIPNPKELLRKFNRANEIISRDEIEHRIQRAGFLITDVERVINALCDAAFLGLEVSPNEFMFVYDDRMEDRLDQAEETAAETGFRRYMINRPFHLYCEIKHLRPLL